MRGRHPFGVELISDGPEGVALAPQAPDLLDRLVLHEDRSAELDAGLPDLGEGFHGALADYLALPLVHAHHDVGHQMTVDCRGVDAEVGGTTVHFCFLATRNTWAKSATDRDKRVSLATTRPSA
jgi:hypothetical protein